RLPSRCRIARSSETPARSACAWRMESLAARTSASPAIRVVRGDARRRRSRKSQRNRLKVFPVRWSGLARRLMQIGHAPPAAAAAQALPELDGREILSEFRNEIGRIEHPAVLAAAADGDEGHLGGDQLPKGPPMPFSRA